MMRRCLQVFGVVLTTVLLWLPAVVQSAEPLANGRTDDARRVFETVRSRVYQVRTMTLSGDAVSSSGSGFLVGENGLIATNWHVVANHLLEPEQYRLEVRRHDNTRGPVRVVGIDALHDLALLQLDGELSPPLPLRTDAPVRGEKGFSIGDPKGVGFTVVEGTYNGAAAQSMAGHLHFTGAINAGMSGGPTLDSDGAVFGINVARRTDADLMGFLVPAEHLAALIARTPRVPRDNAALLKEAHLGMLQAQEHASTKFLEGADAPNKIGGFLLPAVSETQFRCRGRNLREEEEGYATEALTCNNDLYVSAGGNHTAATLGYEYQVITNLSLDPFRFANLISTALTKERDDKGDRKVVGRYTCHTSYVRLQPGTVRATLCIRPFLGFGGLKEAHLRFATVDRSDQALVGDMILRGFSEVGIRFLAREFMTRVEWKR